MQLPHLAGIYRFWHIDSDPVDEYIGSTDDFHVRWTTHKRTMRRGEHNQNVQPIYDALGLEAFDFEILEYVDIPSGASRQEKRDILIPIEQVWMDKRKPTLNRAPRAASPAGMKHTPESIAKIALAHTGMKRSDEARANMSAAQLRRYQRPEERQIISDRRRGQKASPETRKKLSESSATKGKPRDDGIKEKIRATLTGHEVSEETRAKISAANKAAYARKRLESSQSQEGLNGNPDPECET